MSDRGRARREGNVLILPDRGTLLFATDFHGNLADFDQVVALYRSRRAAGEDVHLLFAGDFVHGPAIALDAWPDFLGDPHVDETPTLLAKLEALLGSDPHVYALLGNHEHAHIGGPRTAKFHQDPDEVAFLEAWLGAATTARMQRMFAALPLVALSHCGVLFMHAAPGVRSAGFAEVASASLSGFGHLSIPEIYDVPVIGELLWPKWAEEHVAAGFLARMCWDGITPRVAVYGHDIIEEGFERVASNQVIVSTSFGLRRTRKTLCVVDLGGLYRTATDLRVGIELVSLYPD